MQPVQAENKTLLYIYDDVTEYGEFDWNAWEYKDSETSAKYFAEKLSEIPEGQTIELHINSNGGSVKEGVAIYNLLKQKQNQKVGIVDGVAHSVAFLILQACDTRKMCLGTTALIHNMWMYCSGNATQLRKYADDLDDMMEDITFYLFILHNFPRNIIPFYCPNFISVLVPTIFNTYFPY